MLDFGAGVEASGHTEGEAAVGQWDEIRRSMYGLADQTAATRDLHILGIDWHLVL